MKKIVLIFLGVSMLCTAGYANFSYINGSECNNGVCKSQVCNVKNYDGYTKTYTEIKTSEEVTDAIVQILLRHGYDEYAARIEGGQCISSENFEEEREEYTPPRSETTCNRIEDDGGGGGGGEEEFFDFVLNDPVLCEAPFDGYAKVPEGANIEEVDMYLRVKCEGDENYIVLDPDLDAEGKYQAPVEYYDFMAFNYVQGGECDVKYGGTYRNLSIDKELTAYLEGVCPSSGDDDPEGGGGGDGDGSGGGGDGDGSGGGGDDDREEMMHRAPPTLDDDERTYRFPEIFQLDPKEPRMFGPYRLHSTGGSVR